MKRRLFQLIALLLFPVLIAGCGLWYSIFGVPEEEIMDVVSQIFNAVNDTDANATIEAIDVSGTSIIRYTSEDGTYIFDLELTETGSLTQTYDAYTPPSSDYVVSGVLIATEDVVSSNVTSSTTGTLNLSGGAVTTLTLDILMEGTMDGAGRLITTIIFGTVTANGTEFDVAGLGLEDLLISAHNAT